jgi:hypothetical protein
MSPARRAVLLFVPLVVAVSACFGIVYLVGQQGLRTAANDPQVQLAEDAAAALSGGTLPASVVPAGPPVDIAKSLAPFIVVYDTDGAVLATNGQLDGAAPVLPRGVLDSARSSGRDIVTWQPRSGVRVATVTIPWTGGTVTAGRSLRLVEEREDTLLVLVAAGWLATVAALAVVCAVVARLWRPATRT